MKYFVESYWKSLNHLAKCFTPIYQRWDFSKTFQYSSVTQSAIALAEGNFQPAIASPPQITRTLTAEMAKLENLLETTNG